MEIQTLTDIQTIASPVLTASPATKAIIFGAWSRGTQTRTSDIDMMVISQDAQKRFFDRYEDFKGLYDVFGKTGLDLLIYSGKEVADMKDRSFIQTILHEGVVIYER
jgi:predicted nucleotidyltransferase